VTDDELPRELLEAELVEYERFLAALNARRGRRRSTARVLGPFLSPAGHPIFLSFSGPFLDEAIVVEMLPPRAVKIDGLLGPGVHYAPWLQRTKTDCNIKIVAVDGFSRPTAEINIPLKKNPDDPAAPVYAAVKARRKLEQLLAAKALTAATRREADFAALGTLLEQLIADEDMAVNLLTADEDGAWPCPR
jgi:hypothetical protein